MHLRPTTRLARTTASLALLALLASLAGCPPSTPDDATAEPAVEAEPAPGGSSETELASATQPMATPPAAPGHNNAPEASGDESATNDPRAVPRAGDVEVPADAPRCADDGACGEGLRCDRSTAASCEEEGWCVPPRSPICTREYMPVCGCDGQTYPNDCQRRVAGAALRAPGPCASNE